MKKYKKNIDLEKKMIQIMVRIFKKIFTIDVVFIG